MLEKYLRRVVVKDVGKVYGSTLTVHLLSFRFTSTKTLPRNKWYEFQNFIEKFWYQYGIEAPVRMKISSGIVILEYTLIMNHSEFKSFLAKTRIPKKIVSYES